MNMSEHDGVYRVLDFCTDSSLAILLVHTLGSVVLALAVRHRLGDVPLFRIMPLTLPDGSIVQWGMRRGLQLANHHKWNQL